MVIVLFNPQQLGLVQLHLLCILHPFFLPSLLVLPLQELMGEKVLSIEGQRPYLHLWLLLEALKHPAATLVWVPQLHFKESPPYLQVVRDIAV